MKRAAIYTRVSLDASGEGRSVERQLEACRALAKARGWTVVHELSDNSISAWSGKHRPAWSQVLDLIKDDQIDVVIAWHVDRMTRSMLDLENLILLAEEHDVGIATATGDIDLTTDVGRMVARILGAVARAEVERKAARQRLANRQKAEEGKAHSNGHRPFGFELDRVTIIPEEAEQIRQDAAALLAGENLSVIAERWGRSRTQMRRALLSARYIGLRDYKGELFPAVWPAILDEETQLALKALFDDPKRKHGPGTGRKPTALLSALARCGKCGHPLNAGIPRNKTGGPTYQCKNGCVFVPRNLTDEYVGSAVVALLTQPDILPELVASDDDALLEARAAHDDAKARLDALAEAFAADAITVSQLTTASARLRETLEEAEAVIGRSATGSALSGLSVGTAEVERQWLGLELYRQRALVDMLFDVEVEPANRRRGFDPVERVHVTSKVA